MVSQYGVSCISSQGAKKRKKIRKTDAISKSKVKTNSHSPPVIKNVETTNQIPILSQSTPELPHALGLDCEMVGVGKSGYVDALARVSLIDESETTLLDMIVAPPEEVFDYRTHVTGLTEADFVGAVPFSQAQEAVKKLVEGKIIVGHGLDHDFEVLKFSHPIELIRDTSIFKPLRNKMKNPSRKPSLRLLADSWLGWKIQEGTHDSVEDAKAAMRLYKLVKMKWNLYYKATLNVKPIAPLPVSETISLKA